MKRLALSTVILLLLGITMQAQNRTFVDLGLSSGTRWCTQNETDYWTHSSALNAFGSSLPTIEQFSELIAECDWTWTGSGYRIKGPNGKSIYLPADGFKQTGSRSSCYDSGGKGEFGAYWSYSSLEGPSDDMYSWGLGFNRSSYKTETLGAIIKDQTCGTMYEKYSVRLVQ